MSTAYHEDPVRLIAERFVLENGRPYGECWAPFQEAFFRAVLASESDGRPRHRLVYDERRRGESKTEDCAAAGLADLVTGPDDHRSYAVAGDEDQARLILDSVRGLKQRSPILQGIEVLKNLVVNPRTRSELRVMSSDDRTAFGLRPRRVFFDELSLQVDDRLWRPMWTAIGKRSTAQMVAVSMAGWDFSSIGWEVRELARVGAETGRYFFATREGSELAPWLSPADMEEQRETLHPADYARFWECQWTEPKGSWITREMYEGAVRLSGPAYARQDGRYAGFVDVGLVHDATAIAVVHRTPGGGVHLDALETMRGTRTAPVDIEELEDKVRELNGRFQVSRWIFEAPQAAASVQRLQKMLRGQVELRYPTVETQARLFGTLYRLFSTGQLAIFPHEELRREALNLTTKVIAGRLKVVDSSAIHQDHVIAVGGAAELVAEADEGVLVFTGGDEEEELEDRQPLVAPPGWEVA